MSTSNPFRLFILNVDEHTKSPRAGRRLRTPFLREEVECRRLSNLLLSLMFSKNFCTWKIGWTWENQKGNVSFAQKKLHRIQQKNCNKTTKKILTLGHDDTSNTTHNYQIFFSEIGNCMHPFSENMAFFHYLRRFLSLKHSTPFPIFISR